MECRKRREGMKGYCQYYDAEFEHENILLQTTMSLGFLTHSSLLSNNKFEYGIRGAIAFCPSSISFSKDSIDIE